MRPPYYRYLLWIWLACCAIGLMSCSPHPATLEDVIAKNTEAMGGKAALEAVQSIQLELHVVNANFQADCTYLAMRPGKMRIDVTSDGKHAFTEAFDGERAWQWEGDGEAVAASETASAALKHGLELPGKIFGLHELQGRGDRLELIGRENIDGINYYAIRLTFADNFETTLYVDPNTWLITRLRDVRALHPDVDQAITTMETRNSDFREVGGVLIPFVSSDVDLSTGKEVEQTTIKSAKVNPEMAEAVFREL